MTCLSIRLHPGRPATVVADLYLLDPLPDPHQGAEIRFELLEEDAGHLRTLADTWRLFYIGEDNRLFRGRLHGLQSCTSTHRGLAMLRDQAMLRGVLTIADEPGATC